MRVCGLSANRQVAARLHAEAFGLEVPAREEGLHPPATGESCGTCDPAPARTKLARSGTFWSSRGPTQEEPC